MPFDLGSPVLEIAIALAFVFLLLSLIVTELTELIANAFKLRAANLKQGLEGMLEDKGLVDRLLDHPLVKTDLRTRRKWWQRKQDPSYIAPRNFALVLRDLVRREPGLGLSEAADGLARQLRALTGGPGVALPGVPVLEKWFDESMDRVSGWYKRKAKWITVGLATLVVLGLNVSALRIAERLADDPTVRAAVVVKAEAAANEGAAKGEGAVKQAGLDVEGAVKELDALKLPVWWGEENIPEGSVSGIGTAVIGWLITILAISLGAPFWFDALNKLSNLRMAGKKPEEKN